MNLKYFLTGLHQIQLENKINYKDIGGIVKGRKEREKQNPFQLCIAFTHVMQVLVPSRFRSKPINLTNTESTIFNKNYQF